MVPQHVQRHAGLSNHQQSAAFGVHTVEEHPVAAGVRPPERHGRAVPLSAGILHRPGGTGHQPMAGPARRPGIRAGQLQYHHHRGRPHHQSMGHGHDGPGAGRRNALPEGCRPAERGSPQRSEHAGVGRHPVYGSPGTADSIEPHTDYPLHGHGRCADGCGVCHLCRQGQVLRPFPPCSGRAGRGCPAGTGLQHPSPAGERGIHAVYHARRQRNLCHPAGPVWQGLSAQQQFQRQGTGHQLCLQLELRHRRDLHPAGARRQGRRQHRAGEQEQRLVQQLPSGENAAILGRPALHQRPRLLRRHCGVPVPVRHDSGARTGAVVDSRRHGAGHPPVVGTEPDGIQRMDVQPPAPV